MSRKRRTCKEVVVGERAGKFVLLLDGRPAMTPRGAALALPARRLAEAIAEEWRGPGERLDPLATMLTRLAYSAIDRVGSRRGEVVEHATGFGRGDVLCYRAEAPESLASRQKELWDPFLEWARDKFGLRLNTDSGIGYIEQSDDALLRLRELAAGLDDFALAAFDAAATATASFVLALALIESHASAERVFEAALLEEHFQAESWGRDAEAETRWRRLREELAAIGRFVGFLSSPALRGGGGASVAQRRRG